MSQQSQVHHPPESRLLYGNMSNFPQPGVHSMLPVPGNLSSFDVHRLPEYQDNAFFCGVAQYSGVQHHHPVRNLDMGVVAPGYYNPYMTPSGPAVYPVPINHGFDQSSTSNNQGMVVVSTNGNRANNNVMDGSRVLFKRKTAEGIPVNFQYSNATEGSSSSVVPLNTRPVESGFASTDTAPFVPPQYRGDGTLSIVDAASHGSARNRSSAIGLAYTPNHLIQGNYLGRPFQTGGSPWFDQQFSINGGDEGTLVRNQAPALTYVHGSNMNGGGLEAVNMAMQRYHGTAINGTSASFLHLPPIHLGQNSLHLAPPPMPGLGGQYFDVHSQAAAAAPPHRILGSSSSHTPNPFHDGMGMVPVHLGPVPPTGWWIHGPPQRGVMLENVAVQGIANYTEEDNDQHRDMRLDIDNMSYEELLALGERIGNVGSGLSEETIVDHLKLRTYVFSSCTNREKAADADEETDSCVICQADYKNQELMGTLDCGHGYHADCIKKWLLVKNACPICKSSALNRERRHSS